MRVGDKDILRKCLNKGSVSPQTVLLIGDSFLEALGPHFANYYRKSYILDRKKNRGEIPEVLANEKPALIVVEAVERYIPLLFNFSECDKSK